MNEQYKSLVNWYYIEDWSDYPGPKGRVVPDTEGYDNPSDYDGTELYISRGTIGDKEGNLFIDEEGNDVPFNSEYFEKTNTIKENIMTQEQLRMQMLSGIITEGEYKAKLNESPSMRAYQIAKDLIANMDLPEDAVSDENLFLDVIKALDGQLYEKAADMFAKRAGAAPDENY